LDYSVNLQMVKPQSKFRSSLLALLQEHIMLFRRSECVNFGVLDKFHCI